jgi:hypothetical protein
MKDEYEIDLIFSDESGTDQDINTAFEMIFEGLDDDLQPED